MPVYLLFIKNIKAALGIYYCESTIVPLYWYERRRVMKPSYHHEGISSFCEHRVLIKDLDLHCDDSFGVLLDDGVLCVGLLLRCHIFIAQSKGYRIYLPYQ